MYVKQNIVHGQLVTIFFSIATENKATLATPFEIRWASQPASFIKRGGKIMLNKL